MKSGAVRCNLIRVPARFGLIWFSGFRGEDFSPKKNHPCKANMNEYSLDKPCKTKSR
jgi:hypothetical protein